MIPKRNCNLCSVEYQPKGWMSRFCSKRCKIKKYKIGHPDQVKARRHDRYLRIKCDAERLAKHRRQGQSSKQAVRQWLAEYKLQRGCIDCGYKRYAAALQLDHEGPKIASISELRSSIRRIEAEIQAGKCVVRCANCHSVKTWAQKNAAWPLVEPKTDF